MEVGLGPRHIVLDGELPPKGTQQPLPHFSAHVSYEQTARWIKMPIGTSVGLGPGNIVLDGDSVLPKGAQLPQFLAHVCCGQTAGWVKMPLGTEIDLVPGTLH